MYRFHTHGKDHLYIAALYTDGGGLMLCTRDAIGDLGKVHHRMPVLLEEDEVFFLLYNQKN